MNRPQQPSGTAGQDADLRAELAALRAEVAALRARLDRPGGAGEPDPGGGDAGRFAAMYPAFQDRFRGSESDVRTRLEVYLPDVQQAVTGLGVLDVGPGRGEWLALLAERGITAYGVEDNAEQAARIRQDRSLRVVHGEAVRHLREVAAASLDAVTAFHVVEHLEVEELLALLSAARVALRPGGLLVLETPNPTNLVMAACNFYLDPTHRRPLPPALTSFLVQACGFEQVQTRPLHRKQDVRLDGLRLPGLPETAAAVLAAALDTALFGAQDYAVLAIAPPRT